MTSHKAKVTDFKPCESSVETANRESMSVKGKGRVQIQLSEECGGSVTTLEVVIYLPDLNGNLLSVGRIEERGLHMTFAGVKGEVTNDTGELILTGTREGRLYSVKEEIMSMKMVKTKDTALWHRRLGHLQQDAFRCLCRASEDPVKDKCDTRCLGKRRRSSFPKGVKGYKLWNQKEDRFFVSRDVTFEDESFPCKLTQIASS
ncbi:hypothetical protein HPB49_006711 [Dermacentor silvarum]|uniref:Uncharacterized protein n=1 Tax=Dermacentor silvarum TaxID=543639 RepID=A0ACB8DIA8_DERSI|nr:hypothetical protein HPB49_006711 [Dermacentor silvarum]